MRPVAEMSKKRTLLAEIYIKTSPNINNGPEKKLFNIQ